MGKLLICSLRCLITRQSALYRYVIPLDFEDGDMDTGLEELSWLMHSGKMSKTSTLISFCCFAYDLSVLVS